MVNKALIPAAAAKALVTSLNASRAPDLHRLADFRAILAIPAPGALTREPAAHRRVSH
jgi:hypothetical protein